MGHYNYIVFFEWRADQSRGLKQSEETNRDSSTVEYEFERILGTKCRQWIQPGRGNFPGIPLALL